MQVLGVDFTESLYPVMLELCDAEAAFLHPNMEFNMYIKWPEGIVDSVIISKEFPREYCILLVKSMYVNVYTALLWLRLLAKYLVDKFNLKRSKADS